MSGGNAGRRGPKHFLGLRDASIIRTRDFALTVRAAADAADKLAMVAIHGDAGLGKTFAVSYALTVQPLPAFDVDFPARATMRVIAQTLLKRLTGVRHNADRFLLTEDLMEVLGERERLLVVDEAQRLNPECIEYLRHLHDEEETRFGLVFCGGNGCWEVLSRYPMLESRVFRQVPFSAMTWDEVAEVLPRFHPIYAEADLEILALVDDAYAHGIWRNWTAFTLTAHDLCTAVGARTLTEQVARNAMGQIRSESRAR